MSLRDACIEAATDEFRTCMADDELLNQIPVRLLDAILDTLSENAEEWATKGRNFDNLSATDHVTDMGLAWRLIAALRDSVAGSQ